jgi:hypothetical protein
MWNTRTESLLTFNERPISAQERGWSWWCGVGGSHRMKKACETNKMIKWCSNQTLFGTPLKTGITSILFATLKW